MMNKSRLLRLVPLLLVIWAVLLIRIDAPWYGIQEAPRTWVPAAIRNYDLYGIENTGLTIIRNTGPTTSDKFDYYMHHPPLMIWLPALMTRLVGFHELGVRFVFVAVTLISAAAFYALCRRLYGNSVSWWATGFYGLWPMVAYYGRVPGQDQIGLAVAFLFGLIMLRWLRQPDRSTFITLILLSILAAWSAWTSVFFIGTFCLAAMVLGKPVHRRGAVLLCVIAALAVCSVIGFYQTQWSGTIDSLLEIFVRRTSNESFTSGSGTFTVFEFIFVTLMHTLILVTVGGLVMAAMGLFAAWRYGTRENKIILLSLFLGFLSYQLVFRNASYIHDYYKLTLVPTLAILAALGWVYLHNHRFARPILDALMLLTVGMSVAVLFVLHRSGHRPELQALINALQTETTPADTIFTHLDTKDTMMPATFYAFRYITLNTFADEMETFAEGPPEDGGRYVYLYCPTIDARAVIAPQGSDRTFIAGECEMMFW